MLLLLQRKDFVNDSYRSIYIFIELNVRLVDCVENAWNSLLLL